MKLAVRLAAIAACFALLASSADATETPPCKDGAAATIEGEVTIEASPTDSGGDWMIVAPMLDTANKCTVMDLFGKGSLPKNCSEHKRFRATGTARDRGYALDVKDISCF